jgi:hypothetical protein
MLISKMLVLAYTEHSMLEAEEQRNKTEVSDEKKRLWQF